MPKTLDGTLDTFSLADLLQWLEINGLSGRVTISRGEERRTIFVKGGAVVFVSSRRCPSRQSKRQSDTSAPETGVPAEPERTRAPSWEFLRR